MTPPVFLVRVAEMKPKLIFVVDGGQALADVMADFLKQSGFAVAAFTSPVQALAAAASRKPDLLLSDFTMREMDRSDVRDEAHRAAPHLQGADHGSRYA